MTPSRRVRLHRRPTPLRDSPGPGWLPPAAGVLTGAVGLMNLVSAATPELPARLALLAGVLPHGLVIAADALVFPAGLALTALSLSLARRRRTAVTIAIAVLAAIGGLELLKGFDFEEAAVDWLLALGLWAGRNAFVVRSRFSPVRRAVAATGTAERAAGLVRAHGRDSLSAFKLRPDLSTFISSDGAAFCGYRIENGVLLVSGDPVGPAESLPDLLRDLTAFAAARGLRVAAVGAGESFADLAALAGLRAMYLGDEAMIDTAAFSLQGRPIKKVRQAVNRVRRAGYTAELRPLAALEEAQVRELEAISERWRAGAPERGFSMAMDGLRGAHVADSTVVIARDAAGLARGFLHFVPVYGAPAVSLSAMRRDRDTPNGLTDFLIVAAVDRFKATGIAELSLNFAAFARWIAGPATRRERLLGRLAHWLDHVFQIESLYRFNAKFAPRWQPRYLLYEGWRAWPRTALAAAWAEGQIPKPGRRRRPNTLPTLALPAPIASA